MEDIIREILDRLRAGEALDAKDLLRILNDHNKRLHQAAKSQPANARNLGSARTQRTQPQDSQASQPACVARSQDARSSQSASSQTPQPARPSRPYSKKKLLPFYLRTKERDPETWAAWNVTPELEQQLITLLQVKPRRSASGVATITVITKPWKCGSACIYCPNDLRMPKSYLSDEPACQRAERNYFDPYLQVASRLRALAQMGHVTDKIELIVLGGTWSDYPRDYQIWFITELFRALNDAGANARERRAFYKQHGLSYEKDDLVAFTCEAQQRVDSGEITYNEAMVSLYETGEPWTRISREQQATLEDLMREHERNERAQHRVVGLVVETRPNLITPETLTFLRTLGATKIQMGIQSLEQRIHDINGRPVTVEQIERALDLTRLFGFKTHTHFMVNLLGSTPESDKADFARFVTETPYQPDEIKLYPCALVRGTELCTRYDAGDWQPYDEETLVDVLVADVLATPGFTRISRMIRDFSAHDIEAGNKKVNLRQLVEARAEELIEGRTTEDDRSEWSQERRTRNFFQQSTCEQEPARRNVRDEVANRCCGIQEIRHREISTQDVEVGELTLDVIPYETTSTREFFLQWVTPENKIAGFLRLSLPKSEAFETYASFPQHGAFGTRAQLLETDAFDPPPSALPINPDEAMIREVHVYGRASSLHKAGTSAQHRGLGKQLIDRACRIAREQGYQKINVISAIGTREYYRALGFVDNGLYQQRALA